MAGGLVSQVLKLALLIFVARAYGATEFGAFSFAYSVYAFLYVIAQFGLSTFAAREVAQKGRLIPRLFRSVGTAGLLLAAGGALCALSVLWTIPQVTREEMYLVAGFGLSNVTTAYLSDWVFQGLGKLHGWAALNIVWQGSALLFAVLAVHARAPVWAISFAYAGGGLVATLAGWIYWRPGLRRSGDVTDFHYTARNVLREGAHLGAGTMLQTFLVWIDIVFVRILVGQHGAGLYAAGNRIALGLGMLAGFYMKGAFPLLTRAALEERPHYQRSFQQAYDSLGVIFVPGAIWGIFYAPEILDFVYNRKEYLGAVHVFQVFQLVQLLTAFGIVLYGLGVLLAFRRDRSYRKVFASASLIYLFVCPLFTWRWGITGAAVAALSVQIVLFVLLEIEVRRFVVPNHAEALLWPGALGFAAALLSRTLHFSLLPALCLLILAYAIVSVRWLQNFRWRSMKEQGSQIDAR